jgi:signal transduction histidine kinase/ActR/RegA family two-component response regulator
MIGGWFGRLESFGDKVSWLVTLTSGVAILGVCLLLAVIEYATLRHETLASLESQTQLVTMNSGAPLAFADRYAAAEALDAFRARSAVASATLYDVNGHRFATYLRRDAEEDSPLLVAFTQRWVKEVLPVEDRGQMLGRIEVVYDLRDMQEHLWHSLLLSGLVSLLAVALVFAFSLRIKHVLVKPIALLSSTARKVSETRDYSLRATKVSGDEMGLFTDTFNEMLEQIQKQDLEIQASRQEALLASQLKDEFLATLSHELRTPMTPILGWAQILQRSSNDPSKVLQAAEVIERNARAQNRIVDDLLDMSRIISGKVRLEVRLVDLADIIDASLDTVAAAAAARSIRLEKEVQANLPRVRADPHRMQQVLWNLLSNAIKFTPSGGSVSVSLRRSGPNLDVAVRDTGQGIAPNFLPHVFERFRQADSSNTRQHAGLGLGLAIVKELVELHGGHVRATSAGADKGATFIVSLPVPAEEDTVVRAGVTPMPATRMPEGALSGMQLLVVDDEADARLLIEDILRNAGARVVSAASAREAMLKFAQEQPDLLLSDIGMPGENGYDLVKQVRALPIENGGGVPAIALTAFARPEDRSRALAAGFQMHLAKPVEQGELLAAVSSLLAKA